MAASHRVNSVRDAASIPELLNHLVIAKLWQPVDSPLQRERSEREGPRSICKENKTSNLSEKTRRVYPFLTNSQFLTSDRPDLMVMKLRRRSTGSFLCAWLVLALPICADDAQSSVSFR